MKKQIQSGFTLVEIAIVLVIIGLLIGGVLRGQELISSGRVSAIAAQQSAIKTAYFGFVDRYKFQPGDATAAQALMINARTAPASVPSDGDVLLADSAAFFNNIAQAGFLNCSPCSDASILTPGTGGAAATYTVPTVLSNANTLSNLFAQPLVFFSNLGTATGGTAVVGSNASGTINFLATTAENAKPMLTTGGAVSSKILAELDRKTDDGNASGGSVRYTDLVATTSIAAPFVVASVSSSCISGSPATGFAWAVNPPANCQAVSLF